MLTALFRRPRPSAGTWPRSRRFVVLPAGRGTPCDAARHILEAARRLAAGCAREPVELLAIEAATGDARSLDDGATLLSPRGWRGSEVLVAMNTAFLLADPPPLDMLIARAEILGWALAGSRATRDTHAFAFVPARTPSVFVAAALRHLVACQGDDVEMLWRTAAAEPLVPAAPALAENSPALAGVSGAWARRPPESPRYLNTALRELLDDPAERGPIDADPLRMGRALAAQRARSRVPWIFNTLLNDIEYRLGTAAPSSFPPELHLPLPGPCDVECRFCGGAHDRACPGRVTPDDVERLDVLRQARVLRLDSGLGKPALDRHLPAIVATLAERHPHLGLDLFTQGVGLHEPGIVPTLVGRARRVGVALDAATRDTWRELYDADLFDQVCRNVRALTAAKRERRALVPLLRATTVLHRANLAELPRMPGLCRELGIDRLTARPAYAFDLGGGRRLGADDTLAACRDEYDAVYDETVRQAERHHVSLELPSPSPRRNASLALEVRPLFDFARLETDEWALGRLLGTLRFETQPGAYCAFLWRRAAVGGPRRAGAARYFYPCPGPLGQADLSAHLPFRFQGAADFAEMWRHPLLQRLRCAQREPGVTRVCDACRTCDPRDPREFTRLGALVAEFETELANAETTLSA